MAIRYYLIPIEQTNNIRTVKYLRSRLGSGTIDVSYSMMDYGLVNAGLVMADVTNAQHNAIVANADVTAIPANIDSTITAGDLPSVKAALETLRIPGNWATTANTYRQIMRMVGGLFQFAQRHQGLYNQTIIPDNINLDMIWSDIPLQWRQNLQGTADSFGYDYSQITGSTPVRTILKSLADQWGSTPLLLGGVAI